MSQVFKFIATSIAVAALSACGGGGDSGATPARFTQADIKAVATLGAQAVEETGLVASLGLPFMGGFLEGMANDSGGSRSADISFLCTTGTLRAEVIKTAIRTGLIPGDQVTVTADNCAIAGAGVVVNGVTKLTAQSTIVAPIGGNFAVSFEANMTGFSYTSDSKTAQYDGVANVSVELTGGGNATALSFAVPTGKSFSALITPYEAGKALPAVVIAYSAGTTFTGSDAATPNSASRKLDGSIIMSTGRAPSMLLAISTPSTLSGTTTTGLFVPTSGVIATKVTDENIATSTTVSGVRATVSGDTDGDGSLDLVFDSSWSALMTP